MENYFCNNAKSAIIIFAVSLVANFNLRQKFIRYLFCLYATYNHELNKNSLAFMFAKIKYSYSIKNT